MGAEPGAPPAECRVIHLGVDPLCARYPIRGFPVRCRDRRRARGWRCPSSARAMNAPRRAIAERRKTLAERRAAQRAGWRKLREEMATQTPIHPGWVSHCLSEARDRIFDPRQRIHAAQRALPVDRAGRLFRVEPGGGARLGRRRGARRQARASPTRQVISILGDGSYIFSNPVAVHYASTMHKLPVLTIVINNAMWGAVRRATLGMYPRRRGGEQQQAAVYRPRRPAGLRDDLRGLGRLWRAGRGPERPCQRR